MKKVNSDWLADQWDKRSVFGHAQFHKGRMKGDDPYIDTAQTPKRFNWHLALLGKILKTFTDSIPNKFLDILWMHTVCRRITRPEILKFNETNNIKEEGEIEVLAPSTGIAELAKH